MGYALVCRLLMLGTIGMQASACIVPIPAEPADDPDAGHNSYPIIKDVTPSMPGPLTLKSGVGQQVNFTLSDVDIGDTLFIRIFVDYDRSMSHPFFGTYAVTNDPQNGLEDRQLQIPTNDTRSFCTGITDGSLHQFDVVVADRDFSTSGAFKTPVPPGLTSTRSWLVQCTAQ